MYVGGGCWCGEPRMPIRWRGWWFPGRMRGGIVDGSEKVLRRENSDALLAFLAAILSFLWAF